MNKYWFIIIINLILILRKYTLSNFDSDACTFFDISKLCGLFAAFRRRGAAFKAQIRNLQIFIFHLNLLPVLGLSRWVEISPNLKCQTDPEGPRRN